MSSNRFSPLEIDAIGEILNISLGASATAVSTMLSKRVDITTPRVQVLTAEEFKFRTCYWGTDYICGWLGRHKCNAFKKKRCQVDC